MPAVKHGGGGGIVMQWGWFAASGTRQPAAVDLTRICQCVIRSSPETVLCSRTTIQSKKSKTASAWLKQNRIKQMCKNMNIRFLSPHIINIYGKLMMLGDYCM